MAPTTDSSGTGREATPAKSGFVPQGMPVFAFSVFWRGKCAFVAREGLPLLEPQFRWAHPPTNPRPAAKKPNCATRDSRPLPAPVKRSGNQGLVTMIRVNILAWPAAGTLKTCCGAEPVSGREVQLPGASVVLHWAM